MAKYIDGFVAPVPKKNLARYRKAAKDAWKIYKEHGALSYAEYIEDDVPDGKITSFPMSVKRKKGEVVMFAFMSYKSRKHRDQVSKKVMADPRMQMESSETRPFDGMRMIWGGFKLFVEM